MANLSCDATGTNDGEGRETECPSIATTVRWYIEGDELVMCSRVKVPEIERVKKALKELALQDPAYEERELLNTCLDLRDEPHAESGLSNVMTWVNIIIPGGLIDEFLSPYELGCSGESDTAEAMFKELRSLDSGFEVDTIGPRITDESTRALRVAVDAAFSFDREAVARNIETWASIEGWPKKET
jgi:hypothetical protein